MKSEYSSNWLLFLAVATTFSLINFSYAQQHDNHLVDLVVVQPVLNYYQPRSSKIASEQCGHVLEQGVQNDRVITANFDETKETSTRVQQLITPSPKRLPPIIRTSVTSPNVSKLHFFQDDPKMESNEPAKINPAKPVPNNDATWIRKRIQDVRMDIREAATVAPQDRSDELDYGIGDWAYFYCEPKVFAWYAPNIRYQPLYFEDVALERYGQTECFHRQTLRSACHFFKSTVCWPNQVRHDRPFSCDYPLGFCRPGGATPPIKQIHYLGRPN